MTRLYANENFPLPTVQHLRLLGYDVLTTQDAGRAGYGIPDEEVLAFAIQEKRAVVTINRSDFMRLHRDHPDHTGIIACTRNSDFDTLAAKIHQVIDGREMLHGQLLRVYRGDQRI